MKGSLDGEEGEEVGGDRRMGVREIREGGGGRERSQNAEGGGVKESLDGEAGGR